MKNERLRKMNPTARIGFQNDQAVVRWAVGKVSHFGIWKSGAPIGVGKEPINSFLNKIKNVPLVCPSESRTIKT